MIKITPELQGFLKKEDKLVQFVENASNKKYFRRDYYHYSIAGSFNWKKSPEGVIFWQELHSKFEKELGHLNIHKPWGQVPSLN